MSCISSGCSSPPLPSCTFSNHDQRPDLFLIDFSISENNEISVSIDGDNGVKVEDCIFISREIEGNLDRDEIDFSLKVASCGATSPLIKARQYSKHYGRTLSIKTSRSNDIFYR